MTQGQDLEFNRDKSKRKMGRPLNAKILQEKFCILYATRGDLPAGRCAVEAGYAESSGRVTASKLLKRPDIQARIKQILESGEYNCIVRKPKHQRRKLYSEYYEQAYDWKYNELKQGLGHHYRYCLEERYNRGTCRWKDRQEGHKTHRVFHKQAVEFATEYCDKMFGPLSRRKKKFDRYTKDWRL